MTTKTPKVRTLFCMAVLQNFFDLPSDEIGGVWKATGQMLRGIADIPGAEVLGTLDDDQTMVGAAPTGWPWTFYIMADMPDRDAVIAACNLFRTIEIGPHRLWKYIRVEARMGRELVIPAAA